MSENKESLRSRAPWLFWSAGVFSAACGVILGLLFAMYARLPAMDKLEEYRPNVVTRLLDRNGNPFRELYIEKRVWVPFDKIPANLINAVVAAEDGYFFKHKGVRLLSILRALITDIRKGSMAQGGSTITQQLAKVMFLSSEKKISRKIKEALLAIEIEKRFTKEEIFEFYANQIPLGSGAFGVEAASRIYFGKPVGDLTLAESAMIAGLPKAPERYSPLKNVESSVLRRNTVLSRMREEGYITREEELAALAEPLALAGGPAKGPKADHFTEIVRAELEKKFGAAGLYREGLEVTATLDAPMQEAAERAVAEGLAAINEQEKRAGGRHDGAEAQAALVAIDAATGRVLAMVGSSDFSRFQFNHATQARRQPGSAFKPFIFLAALERGFTPASVIVDSPIAYPKPGGGGFWKPENYSNKFYGPVTLRKALENSLNVSTVKLLREVGEGRVMDAARRLGVASPLSPNLSLALGSSEVTLLELTSSYAALANRGIYNPPSYILSAAGPDGSMMEADPPRPREAVKPEAAYVLTNMLIGVVENGTGQLAKIPGRRVAGKTGTTSENRDAWFIGYTPDIAAGVWVGFDDNRPLSAQQTGGRAAAPIWAAFMKEALKGAPSREFPPPAAVVARLIGRDNGLLANEYCRDSFMEVFIAGMEPSEYCKPEESGPEKKF